MVLQVKPGFSHQRSAASIRMRHLSGLIKRTVLGDNMVYKKCLCGFRHNSITLYYYKGINEDAH